MVKKTAALVKGISDNLIEGKTFLRPSEEFQKNANIQDRYLYEQAKKDPEAFWGKCAESLDWMVKWDAVLEQTPPFFKWFVGGKLNVSVNCLDRHVATETRDKAAVIWVGEGGEEKKLTYKELYSEVNLFANSMKALGVTKGDRVAIYLPQVPEAIIAMLACSRIGAVHTVVFGGFSADSLQGRIQDCEAKLLITADGGFRRGRVIPLKETSDEALRECPSIQHVVVIKRTGAAVSMTPGRDLWYHEALKGAAPFCKPEVMDSEDLLFVLYTSGTTDKPKGIMHTTAGYLLGVTMTMQWVFDIKPKDIFWCTADVGWITGHSYVVYGPLSNGVTQVVYEGTPDWPDRDRLWRIIEKYKVSVFYTAPTAIRASMKWGEQWPGGCDLSSLRLLGSVGEPINPAAWTWYYKHIGKERCPIVDTWWQTETGSILMAPLPGLTPLKPGSATMPLPGIDLKVLNEEGEEITCGSGYLAITKPWPSMIRGIYRDTERYQSTYWNKWNGEHYFTGDGARIDEDGYFWLLGRVDDVINVAGHRIGTAEVENALVDHPSVAEAAVIAVDDEIKGQAIVGFVILKEGHDATQEHQELLLNHVAHKIGAIARPKKVIFARDLPKTRSGKIMRRILRDIAEGRVLGDTTTLADPTILGELGGPEALPLDPS